MEKPIKKAPVSDAPSTSPKGKKTPATAPHKPTNAKQLSPEEAKREAAQKRRDAAAAEKEEARRKKAEEDELQKHTRVINVPTYNHEEQNPHAAL